MGGGTNEPRKWIRVAAPQKPFLKSRTLLFFFFFLHRAGESLCASSVAHPEERGCCRSCGALSENDTSSILCLFQAQGLHTQHGAC